MPHDVIDRKFIIRAENPVTGKTYTEADAILLCAKDKAVPYALQAYMQKCLELGCDGAHIESIAKATDRVIKFQEERGGGRIPDTVGNEIPRCIHGVGLEGKVEIPRYLMEKLRQKIGLEKDDTSLDDVILARRPEENLREVCAWEIGSPSWVGTFMSWAADLGIKEVSPLNKG